MHNSNKIPVIYYIYDPVTKKYLYKDKARLSPADKKKGKLVYLKPKNATFIKPEKKAGKEALWNTEKKEWEYRDSFKIKIKIEKKINFEYLQANIRKIFKDGICKYNKNYVIINGVKATKENTETIEEIIEKHNIEEIKEIEKRDKNKLSKNLKKINRIAWQVLIEEIGKRMDFLNFDEFENLVSAKKEKEK